MGLVPKKLVYIIPLKSIVYPTSAKQVKYHDVKVSNICLMSTSGPIYTMS